ncbi:MAG: hypothetical protein DHS20C18_04360 [Saprospiraceae bacterium]|nr:MAG: hypothetical protein DHS20C18_04360 [Saprospiraceae bacterium]
MFKQIYLLLPIFLLVPLQHKAQIYGPDQAFHGNSFPFITHFNCGKGRFYNEAGKRLSKRSWKNAEEKDILPTWQWYTDLSKIQPEFDFSESYTGGSCLRLDLSMQPGEQVVVPLYRSCLILAQTTHLNLVTKGNGTAQLFVSLLYADGVNHIYPIKILENWSGTRHSLATGAGKQLIQISLQVVGGTDNRMPIYIGEVALYNAPILNLLSPKVYLKARIHDLEAEVFLTIANAADYAYYNVYQLLRDGSRKLLGSATTPDCAFGGVEKELGQDYSTLIIEPVGRDGTYGKEATISFDWYKN